MALKKIKKGAKKKFFEVAVPLASLKTYLYAYSQEELVGKVVKIDMTKNLRGKNMELRARIKQTGEKLEADLISLQLLQSYIKKSVYRGTDYVEDSFESNCKDAKLRIKPFLIARNRISRAIQRTIRNAAKKHIEGKIKIKTSDEILSDIMANKMQKELSLKIKKIYPLALCEIRMIEIINKITPDTKAKKETKPEEQVQEHQVAQ